MNRWTDNVILLFLCIINITDYAAHEEFVWHFFYTKYSEDKKIHTKNTHWNTHCNMQVWMKFVGIPLRHVLASTLLEPVYSRSVHVQNLTWERRVHVWVCYMLSSALLLLHLVAVICLCMSALAPHSTAYVLDLTSGVSQTGKQSR